MYIFFQCNTEWKLHQLHTETRPDINERLQDELDFSPCQKKPANYISL